MVSVPPMPPGMVKFIITASKGFPDSIASELFANLLDAFVHPDVRK